jgi:prepilin-type processing-associated H-X9-DG protein
MPLIEQDANAQQIITAAAGNLDTTSYIDTYQNFSGYKPTVFLCPADPQQGQTTAYGFSNYQLNSGTWTSLATQWDGFFAMLTLSVGLRNNAPAGPLKPYTVSHMSDGLSQTVAYSESCNAKANTTLSVPPGDPKSDCFVVGGAPTTSAAAARAFFLAQDWKTKLPPGSGSWRFRGYPYTEGSMWRSMYNHLLPPNNVCWYPGQYGNMVAPAGSRHTGGVNAVMGDGAVIFYKDSINPDIWLALGTRAAGDTVSQE